MRAKLLSALLLFLAIPMGVIAWERELVTRPDGKIDLARCTTFQIHGWDTNPSGEVTVKELTLDLDKETDISSESRLGFTLTHTLSKRNSLALAFTQFDHGGMVRKGFTFNGRKYQVGSRMKLQSGWFDLTWARNLAFWGKGEESNPNYGFFDCLLGIKVGRSDLDVAGYTPGTGAYTSGTWNQYLPVPYLGIGGGNRLSRNIWVDGHFKFMALHVMGARVRSYDFDVNAAVRLNPRSRGSHWLAVLGFRNFHLSGDIDKDSLSLGYRGPVFGFLGRF